MLHKTWSLESPSISGADGIKLSTEGANPVETHKRLGIQMPTGKETQAEPKDLKAAQIEQKMNENSVTAARGVNQNTEPQPGPSCQSQDGAKIQQNPAISAVAWAGDKSIGDLGRLQNGDPDIGLILRAKVEGDRPSGKEMVSRSPACRHYWILWDSLVVEEGLLFKKFIKKDGTGEYLQFIVPKAMKQEVLFQMHSSILSGHLGCKKTKEKNPSEILLVCAQRRHLFAHQKM